MIGMSKEPPENEMPENETPENATAVRIDGIAACVFDAYGTLFDVHAAAAALAGDIGPQATRLSDIWRSKQLEYSWLRSLMGAHRDFWGLTGDALDHAMQAVGLGERPELRRKLLELYWHLDSFPEVAGMLDRLRQGGVRTAILSNGSPDMLSAAVAAAGLGTRLDAVISAEEAGIFKPDARVYQLAPDRLGVGVQEICFLSSNGWDVAGAGHFGFRVVWINRRGQPADILPGRPCAQIPALDRLPAMLGLA